MNKPSDLQTDTFLPYMHDVMRCEQSLGELSLMWRMIESSAKMNCASEAKAILPTMAATRAGFDRLEQELVASLAGEKVANVLTEIGTKAQYVIDIVVRNLYERTADVGFLATDSELCAFVAGLTQDQDAIRYRLRAYRSKYTVYDEIMLLDPAGNVLVQIDEHTPVEGSLDPLIGKTLASDGHVETFRATDLRPGKQEALIYSRRMLHPHTGEVAGILCLCFNFEDEMAGIFRSHRDADGRSNMLLLDRDNRVIASADPYWVAPGVQVPVNRAGLPRLMVHGGRQYLVRTYCAEGYQGYMGPDGWQGQVMIPVDLAFCGAGGHALAELDPAIADGLLTHARTFSPPLYEIMTAVDSIRRVVWNGQVMTAGQGGDVMRLKTILEQINETGARSNQLFSRLIRDLYETVLDSSLRGAEFVSHLMVDLLDRNLYERSDDCRWWALTPQLRGALAFPQAGGEARITAILRYINELYTVYTRIFVYDRNGRILAATGAAEGPHGAIVGSSVDAATLEAVLGLASEQQYHVTPFAETPLYDGAPTYVYHAAIRHPDHEAQVVGGIGIVFDAAPEFSAMLRGALGEREAVTALFVGRDGQVISSTDPARPVGTRLELEADLASLANGASLSRIVVHDGHYAILGCTASCGYREFKTSDGYREDVLALVYESFGEVRALNSGGDRSDAALEPSGASGSGREFATFFVQDGLFALPAEHVLEALPAERISPVSMGGRNQRMGVVELRGEGRDKRFVWTFDLHYLIHGVPGARESGSQVIVVQSGERTIGLLVGDLHGVPEFEEAQIIPTPFAGGSQGSLIGQVIKANRGRLLIQAIDVDFLFKTLADPEQEAASAPLKLAA